MSILKTLALLITFMALLGGCSRPSEDYQAIKALPEEQWDTYAAGLPIKRRLDLHLEIMSLDGPNPSTTIIGAFAPNPLEAYEEIVRRIRSGTDTRYFVSILYEINRNDQFDICEMDDRKIVQTYLWEYATDAVAPMDRPDFYRC